MASVPVQTNLGAQAWAETRLCDLCAKTVPHECLMSASWRVRGNTQRVGALLLSVQMISFFFERRCTNCDKTESVCAPEEAD